MRSRANLRTVGVICLAAGVATALWFGPTAAQEQAAYVGADRCAACHQPIYDAWKASPHHRTVLDPKRTEAQRGCEACHGPGSQHVEGGGDPKLIRPIRTLSADKSAGVCLSCHKQADLTHWRTSPHAQQSLTCVRCHDPHDPTHSYMLTSVAAARNTLEGLERAIKLAQQAVAELKTDSPEQKEAMAKLTSLNEERSKLQAELKGYEGHLRKVMEPELCLTCHVRQRGEFNLPSHHPVFEGKMKCTGCHSPHGGISVARDTGWVTLRGENVNETCYKCHADKEGPFVFEHPPVTEECTICHKPHGTAHDRLLRQPSPALCLRCHMGPHTGRNRTTPPASQTRPGTFNNSPEILAYYADCTNCHAQIHGSDRHAAFHR